MRILLVSPEHPEATWLHKAFRESAHSVQRADDIRDGVFLATHDPFDAIVALAMEPASQAELLHALPALSSVDEAPVIIALVRGLPAAERVRLLRAGADVCLTPPYSFVEIHERIVAMQRITVALPAEPVSSAAQITVQLDAATRELVAGAGRVALTRREYQLLECLLRRFDAPVPRDQLIRYAWSEKEEVDPACVNLVVSRLRRKLAGRCPQVRIETVSRYGYQLSAEA
ncbi:response regulator transcription factor [Paraburkholderia rhizosphaerae]|uniref:Winged helix family two component transcriptional regulator n=1 Tax=Paraburkholderia rhizosphaerae TaxID=480658 RepID=A0A4R8L4J8_9BURK|nr:response regulator transcription factor [Paraburkholderia rhizosphaerae]TDY37461.1 winged helix family two component transcriptional regulator [Paraburkholderia rhizosphaerae]